MTQGTPMQQPPEPVPTPPPSPALPPLNLSYSTPSQLGRRPGVLTAVAVISIVLGAFGILSNGMGVASGVMQLYMARMPGAFGPMVPPPAPTSVVVTRVTTGPATGATTTTTTAPTPTPTTAFVAAGPGAAPMAVPSPFTTTTAVLTMVDAVASLALAALLLVAGIMVIRESPGGRRWLKLYAWLKIPVSLLGGVAMWVIYATMFKTIAATTPGPAGAQQTTMMMGFAVASSVVMTVIYCVFPVALLIVLTTRQVREYYNFLGGGRA